MGQQGWSRWRVISRAGLLSPVFLFSDVAIWSVSAALKAVVLSGAAVQKQLPRLNSLVAGSSLIVPMPNPKLASLLLGSQCIQLLPANSVCCF